MKYSREALHHFFRAHKFAVSVIIVLVVGGGWYYVHTKGAQTAVTYRTAPAQKTTIVQTVVATGLVAANQQLDVKPQTSGTVISLPIIAGQTVRAGQVLALLDQKSAAAGVTQARASVASAEANYEKVLAGATSADIAVSKLSVTSAEHALKNAQTALQNTTAQQVLAVKNAYANTLNAGIAAISVEKNLGTATITISGTYQGTTEGSYHLSLFPIDGTNFQYTISGLETGTGTLIRGVPFPIGSNGLYFNVSTSGVIYGNDAWDIPIPNLQASGYLNARNAYQAALLSQTQALATAQNAIDSAQSSLDSAQAALVLKEQAASPADIASAEAQIANAKASLQSAEVTLANTVITAPFDGVVAAVPIQKGEQISSASIITTMVTKQKMVQISLNEVDAARVSVGQKASFSFDALSGLRLDGTVASMDTLATVTQGVSTYGSKISLDTQDDRIKPGMSVSATIVIATNADVIAVPNAAVKTRGTSSYVEEVNADGVTTKQVPVTVGVSNDTLTEITSGLNEGEVVVTQTLGGSTAAAGTSTTGRGGGGIGIPGLGGGGGFRGVRGG